MNILKKSAIATFLIFGLVAMLQTAPYAATRGSAELRRLETNLDTLGDKEGSLHQIIEELQGFTMLNATAPAAGIDSTTSVKLPGIATDDNIAFVLRFASANNVAASSTTNSQAIGAGDPDVGASGSRITFVSKLWGDMGNNVQVVLTQISTLPFTTEGTLSIVTTGYAIEVKLSTGQNEAFYSSGSAVVNAINTDPAASLLVDAFVNFAGTATVVPVAQFNLGGGLGTPQSVDVIPASFWTITSSQSVTPNEGTPVTSQDGLIFGIHNRPDLQ